MGKNNHPKAPAKLQSNAGPDPDELRLQDTKICVNCQQELPATGDFYDQDESQTDGLKTWCKACRKKNNELTRVNKFAALLETLDDAMAESLMKVKPGGTVTPHQLEFFQLLTTLMGGVNGVAQHWASQYVQSKPGGQIRERMLRNWQRLMENCSEGGKVTPPPELMSDRELMEAIARDEERMKRNEERMKEQPPPGSVVQHDVIDAQ